MTMKRDRKTNSKGSNCSCHCHCQRSSSPIAADQQLSPSPGAFPYNHTITIPIMPVLPVVGVWYMCTYDSLDGQWQVEEVIEQ